jgi:putative ABC transport system permease protein
MGTLRLDLRYAIRSLTKRPLFTIVAVATLALSIGANTAIFSVVNAVLLRQLPYYKPNQLVALSTISGGGERDGLSVPEAEDFRAQMSSLEDVAFFQTQSVNVTGGERPDRVRGAFVSANYFRFFNLNPIVGRTFVEGEDRQGAPKLAVVNEKMWRERLNADPNLNDKKLTLNGETYSVIGVVTGKFKHPFDPDGRAVDAGRELSWQHKRAHRKISVCARSPKAWRNRFGGHL